MADEQPQNPNNQGTAPQQPPQQAQPQPQQAQPPQQPPPPPANAQEVIARQQAALQEQIAMAQQRDRAQFGPAAEGVQAPAPVLGGVFAQASQAQQQSQPQQQQSPPPPQGFNLPQGATAQQVAQGIPHAAQVPAQQQYAPGLAGIPNPAYPQQGGMQQPDFSRLPDPSVPQNGVTVQQLAAQSQMQGGPPPQYGQQSYQQQQPSQQSRSESNKPTVLWHPARNSKLIIELDDSYVGGLPESIEQETNPQAKIVAVLLSEILSLRARVAELEQGGAAAAPNDDLAARVYRLEMTLYEQQQALTQRARAVREEAERQAVLDLHKQQQEGQGNGEGTPTAE